MSTEGLFAGCSCTVSTGLSFVMHCAVMDPRGGSRSSFEEAGHAEHGVTDVEEIPAFERPPEAGAQRECHLPLRAASRRHNMRRRPLDLLLPVAAAACAPGTSSGARDVHRRRTPTARRRLPGRAVTVGGANGLVVVVLRPHHLPLAQLLHLPLIPLYTSLEFLMCDESHLLRAGHGRGRC
ncbi:hypothetical protein B296_00001606 [Ensete ventricosum]|uniref:Uncharacterized protein n=1 Tax=Ensete ventricosum TaxID=4639 RepID=A0A427AFB5_ENSVE|nr:hypothetical protein B296_00001606 [Ensete ventricosum]